MWPTPHAPRLSTASDSSLASEPPGLRHCLLLPPPRRLAPGLSTSSLAPVSDAGGTALRSGDPTATPMQWQRGRAAVQGRAEVAEVARIRAVQLEVAVTLLAAQGRLAAQVERLALKAV